MWTDTKREECRSGWEFYGRFYDISLINDVCSLVPIGRIVGLPGCRRFRPSHLTSTLARESLSSRNTRVGASSARYNPRLARSTDRCRPFVLPCLCSCAPTPSWGRNLTLRTTIQRCLSTIYIYIHIISSWTCGRDNLSINYVASRARDRVFYAVF